MKCIISGFYPAVTCEEVDEKDAKFEFVMLALRTKYGVSLKEYKSQFGTNVGDDFPKAFQKSLQYLELNGDNLRIKDEYLYVQNSVLMPFVDEIPMEKEAEE
jgi:coproporphyrinogen III oxidase-like Fe-S oxidoreductase